VARRVLVLAVALLVAACTDSSGPAPQHPHARQHAIAGSRTVRPLPKFAHIVVVVEENHSYREVIGNSDAPYLNHLARAGALLTKSHGVTHPSEPNYLALFSGSTHGLTDDSCPLTYRGRNLASQLLAHGQTFAGYAESLPRTGYLGCSSGAYARKHAPWTDFGNVPRSVGRPMGRFPSDFNRLPHLAFVVPNLNHDMHDGTIAQADTWLRTHLASYVRWASAHDSLLIVTWDEDDQSANNHIPGLLVGAHVKQTRFTGRVDHYRLLRTLEAICRLPALRTASRRTPIRAVWTR
jgi:acid phosphatase